MRISQGSLARLRRTGKCQVYPTTCYLMVGERCKNSCSFCAQNSSEDRLSRITWPKADKSIIHEINSSDFRRVCLQCTSTGISQVKKIAEEIRKPLSISYNFSTTKEVDELMAHAERICIPLDCADEDGFRKHKHGDFDERLNIIKTSAAKYKNRVSTHLIAGLGESRTEMIKIIRKLHSWGVTIGLFAFTPLKEAKLDNRQPDIGYYREIQAFYHRLKRGKLTQEAFQTTGCKDCNRPYYNERAGGQIYNYPRELRQEEYDVCIRQIGKGN